MCDVVFNVGRPSAIGLHGASEDPTLQMIYVFLCCILTGRHGGNLLSFPYNHIMVLVCKLKNMLSSPSSAVSCLCFWR